MGGSWGVMPPPSHKDNSINNGFFLWLRVSRKLYFSKVGDLFSGDAFQTNILLMQITFFLYQKYVPFGDNVRNCKKFDQVTAGGWHTFTGNFFNVGQQKVANESSTIDSALGSQCSIGS